MSHTTKYTLWVGISNRYPFVMQVCSTQNGPLEKTLSSSLCVRSIISERRRSQRRQDDWWSARWRRSNGTLIFFCRARHFSNAACFFHVFLVHLDTRTYRLAHRKDPTCRSTSVGRVSIFVSDLSISKVRVATNSKKKRIQNTKCPRTTYRK